MGKDSKRVRLFIAAILAAAGLGFVHYYPRVGAGFFAAALMLALNTTIPPRK